MLKFFRCALMISNFLVPYNFENQHKDYREHAVTKFFRTY
jgi:hypothetical protein